MSCGITWGRRCRSGSAGSGIQVASRFRSGMCCAGSVRAAHRGPAGVAAGPRLRRNAASRLDWFRRVADSSHVRAERGSHTGPWPVDRPRRQPGSLFAERGHDHDIHRDQIRARGIMPAIARRSAPHRTQLGTHRRVVERSCARLHGFRRLRIRGERRVGILSVPQARLLPHHPRQPGSVCQPLSPGAMRPGGRPRARRGPGLRPAPARAVPPRQEDPSSEPLAFRGGRVSRAHPRCRFRCSGPGPG